MLKNELIEKIDDKLKRRGFKRTLSLNPER